jgi:hypothetical protein
MKNVRLSAVSSVSRAFSSLAVTVAMAALTILALAFGTVQDSKAETEPRPVLRGVTSAEQP